MKVERIGKSLQGENDVVLRNMQKGINTVGSTRLMIRLVKIKTSYAKWKTQKRNTHKYLTIGPACVGQWPVRIRPNGHVFSLGHMYIENHFLERKQIM